MELPICSQEGRHYFTPADSPPPGPSWDLDQSSLSSGIIPASFKTATVKPLLKKPTLDSADIRNYRPVSLILALLMVTESLGDTRASSSSSVLILLDLSSAFDTVNHQILLFTPHSAELGIADCALTWFTSLYVQVTWNSSLSKRCFLETGVPQGSVLGPLLFSLCTRSLGFAITSLLWSDPADLPSATSAGSDLSSQKTWRNS